MLLNWVLEVGMETSKEYAAVYVGTLEPKFVSS